MTIGRGAGELSPQVERELVAELGQLVLEQTAPEELAIFPETAREYFDDPQAVLDPGRRDEPVGFGLELALLTPYVLAVVTPVIHYLATTVADAVREEVTPVLVPLVRRLFRRPDQAPEAPDDPTPLRAEQLRHVREVAYQQGKGLGLEEERASMLADAVVGRLATS
jgi:hypothetical protein